MTFLRRAPFIRRRGAGSGVSQFAYTGTLTAGSYFDGFSNYYGYRTDNVVPFGSISPASSIIVSAFDIESFGSALNIVVASDPGQFSINYVNYNGTIFNSSAAVSYNYDTGVASWSWGIFGMQANQGVAKTFIIA